MNKPNQTGSPKSDKPKKSKTKAKRPKKSSTEEPSTASSSSSLITNAVEESAERAFQSNIYEAFFKLSQFEESTRHIGTRQLCTYYVSSSSESSNRNFRNYIITRLIKGLASNRKCSRLGFSCALTAIFDSFEGLTFDQLINSAHGVFKLNAPIDTKNLLSKEEMRHMQVGLAFVYLSFVQSNRVETADDLIISRLITDLNTARKNNENKFYVQQIYLQTLILLIRKNSDSIYSRITLPAIEKDLKNGLFNENARNDFNLALACLNSHPELTKKAMSVYGDCAKAIVSNKTYEYLSQSTETLPKVHPIGLELVNYLSHQEPNALTSFWLDLIDSKLCARKEVEKKYLSYKLFFHLFNLLTEDNYNLVFDGCLLKSERILQTLAINFLNKKNNLNKISKELFRELVDLFKVKEAQLIGKSCAGLLVKLISNGRNFYDLSELISATIPVLNQTGLRIVFEHLTGEMSTKHIENGFNLQEEAKVQEEAGNNRFSWIVSQFFAMSKNANTFKDSELITNILEHLMSRSYFGVKDEKLEGLYREALLKFVGILLSKNEISANLIIIQLIQNFIKSVEIGMCGKKKAPVLCAKFADRANEIKTFSGEVSLSLISLNKMCEISDRSDEDKHVLHIFFMITTIEFFRMFDTFKSSRQVIRDVEFCVKEFTGEISTTNGHNNDKKLPWIDMTVEMLLSLLTINKHWIRSEVKNQFKKLIPKLTSDSVKLVIDLLAVENDLLEEEDDMSDDDEDDDEDEGDEEENDVEMGEEENGSIDEDSEDNSEQKETKEKGKKRKISESEEEESGEEEENGDKNAVLDMTFSSIGQFNGAGADSGEESDLNDEQMMQMDDKIAAAFKMRLHEKTNDSLKLQYKLKALDLVQELFRTTQRLDLVVESIKPVLNVLFESQKRPNLKNVSQRILGFFANLKNTTKKLDESKLPSIEQLFETLNYIIECSTNHFNVINTLVEASMFCVKIIINLSNTSLVDQKETINQKLISIYMELIKNDKIRVNALIYKEFLVRHPEQSIPLVNKIIDSVDSNELKVFKKTYALITLNQTINNQLFTKAGAEAGELLIKKIFLLLEKILDEIIKNENLNIKFVDAFLNLTQRSLNLQKGLLNKQICENLASKLSLLTKDTKLKQAHKSRLANLVRLCQNFDQNQKKNNKNK